MGYQDLELSAGQRAEDYRSARLRHRLGELPFRGGLTFCRLKARAEEAGFTEVSFGSYGTTARAQRRIAAPGDWLRTWLYRRFILAARKSGSGSH